MPVTRRKLASILGRTQSKSQPQPVSKPQPSQSQEIRQRAYDVKGAAKYLGTSLWQVRKWKYQGLLKAFRYLGVEKPKDMFAVEVLDAFLERSKEAAAA